MMRFTCTKDLFRHIHIRNEFIVLTKYYVHIISLKKVNMEIS